jgi:hypothetical protein
MLSTELDIPLLLVLATGKANDTRNVVVPVFLLPTLFETFFFGMVMFSETLECVTETEGARGVLSSLRLLNYHLVGLRAQASFPF